MAAKWGGRAHEDPAIPDDLPGRGRWESRGGHPDFWLMQMNSQCWLSPEGLCRRGAAVGGPRALSPTAALSSTWRLKGALYGQLNRWDLLHGRYNPSSSFSYKNPGEQARSPREMTDGKRTVEPRGDTFRLKIDHPINRSRTWSCAENIASISEWEQRKVKSSSSPCGDWDPLHCQKEVSFKIRSFLSASISFSVLLKG